MKKYFFISALFLLIAGCGSTKNSTNLKIQNINIAYHGNAQLEEQLLGEDTMDGIVALYQENTESNFKDSLIAVEKYNQGKGVNVFSQESIQTLKEQGLGVQGIKIDRSLLSCGKETKSTISYSYTIDSGFQKEIPTLYMTQLFIESGSNIVVLSHSTEDKSEQKNISKAFSTIYCK